MFFSRFAYGVHFCKAKPACIRTVSVHELQTRPQRYEECWLRAQRLHFRLIAKINARCRTRTPPSRIVSPGAVTHTMEIVFTVLILLLTVALLRLSLSLLPVMKLPLAGSDRHRRVLTWPGFGLHVSFDLEIFMLLFIPPLLFADG